PPGSTACRSRPSSAAIRSTARVQLSVQASGSQPPSASANPATTPLGSAGRPRVTAYTVPDVPRLSTGVPVSRPRPSAAALLAPAPAPTSVPSRSGTGAPPVALSTTLPAALPGSTTSGSAAGERPTDSSSCVS